MNDPYQPIDTILGRDVGVKVAPIAGWAISCPTNGTTLVEGEDVDAVVADVYAKSNFPHRVAVFSAWIHSEEGCMGGLSKRRHWTPR